MDTGVDRDTVMAADGKDTLGAGFLGIEAPLTLSLTAGAADLNNDGTFTVTIVPRQTSSVFSLVNTGVLANRTDPTGTAISSTPLIQAYGEPSPDPFLNDSTSTAETNGGIVCNEPCCTIDTARWITVYGFAQTVLEPHGTYLLIGQQYWEYLDVVIPAKAGIQRLCFSRPKVAGSPPTRGRRVPSFCDNPCLHHIARSLTC